MPIIRLVLLLGLAGGLFLLVQFNWTPLPLTFLGIQLPALPLALWILGAIAAGMVTNLFITGLFGLSNYFAVRAARSQWRQASRRAGFAGRSSAPEPTPSYTRTSSAKAADEDADWNNWEGYEQPGSRSSSGTRTATNEDPIDDWETDPDDDWDETPKDTPVDSRASASRVRTDYEAKQEPKTASRSGSVYSYSYRDPKGSGVGKTEPVVDKPVVDAEYRVIVPPYRSLDDEPTPPSPAASEESADDWFEDDSDEFEDNRDRDRSRQ